jgi:DNA-binding response OmpR family regulator
VSSCRVLVVEDDDVIGRNLRDVFASDGYDVDLAGTAGLALDSVARHPPALVVLDLGLPDSDGVELCRVLRERHPGVRILILTARREEVDVVVGLDAGADDYIRKPFSLSELLARVRVQLRQPTTITASAVLEVGDLMIDTASRRVTHNDDEIELRPKEYDLLALLAAHAGSVLTREQLMDRVWREPWFGSTKTLDVHMSHLRKKLSSSSVRIATLRHVGYRLDP